ncbi:putative E3 ubiquitin-protein ligase [Coemansia thaxteri]|nr:putative E3 ubiquitin-protein ligase [Coemansia thaxteri]KAJ2469460.1 putative E3 ubiquitin-protein ligase [Coemansia sp. RSA 2322]
MVVSQLLAPLRTLKNRARGRATAAATAESSSNWSDDEAADEGQRETAAAEGGRDEGGKGKPAMTTGLCLCCGSKVVFPLSVACFKCTVCDTINDLQTNERTDQTGTRSRIPPPPLTLERLKAGVAAFRRHSEKQALLEAMLRESFGNWDALNFSFATPAGPSSADDPGIAMSDVHAAYKIILALPAPIIRAMMSGIEQILRRPGRPLKQRGDIRYLLIIIENPLLVQQSFPQEASYHHHIVKSIVGSMANLPPRMHYALVVWLAAQHSRASLRRKVDLVSQFVSYRVQKYDRARRRNPRAPVAPLTSYSSQSNQTELPAFQRTRSSTNGAPLPGSAGRLGRHVRMRSNTDSRISLSSHERSVTRSEPPLPPPPPPPPADPPSSRRGLGIANIRISDHRTRVPTAPSHLHLRDAGTVQSEDESALPSSRSQRSRTMGAWAVPGGVTPPLPTHARDSPKLPPAELPEPLRSDHHRPVQIAGSAVSALGVLDGTAEPDSPMSGPRQSLTRTRSSSEAPTRRRAAQRDAAAAAGTGNSPPSWQAASEWGGGVSVDDYYVGADGVFYPKTSSLNMHQHDWRLVAAAKVMALLHAANLLLPARMRLGVDEFYNRSIDNMDLIADYDAWQARVPSAFSFCQYPFLLTLRAKVQIMQVDAARQMDSKLKEAVISALFQTYHASSQLSQPHLKLLIRRRCLVEDSLHQLATHEQDLKKRLKIEFVGEEGVDAGGLAKEWFMLLVRELMNPMYGMFVRESTDAAFWFNPASLEASNQYFLVGVVVGLALYNSTILDLHFPLAVFKKLLRTSFYQSSSFGTSPALFAAARSAAAAGADISIVNGNHFSGILEGGSASSTAGDAKPSAYYAPRYGPGVNAAGGASSGTAEGRSPIYGLLSPSAQLRYQINEMLADVAQFRPHLARGLRALLQYRDNDVEDTFCLSFEASYEAYGEVITVPLISNGANTQVNSQNRVEYVMRYLQWVLNDSIAKQFEPFKRGFYYVCGGNALSLFKPEEIELMVHGSGDDWRSSDLMAITELSGFAPPADCLVVWFWEVLEEMTPADRRLFLAFVTGTDRMPTVASSSSGLRLKLVLLGADYKRLPIAHTCFNQLGIWSYRSKEELRDKLLMALRESEGFGLK